MRRIGYQPLTIPLLTAVLLFLSACGFQLQGRVGLTDELQNLHVVGVTSGTNLSQRLHRSLQANGVTLDPDSKTILAILTQNSSQQAVTYTGSGQGARYDVTNRLSFQLQNEKGTRLMGPYELQAQRSYQVDQNNTTASIAERNLLDNELQKKLVNQMLRRLQAVSATELQQARENALEREQQKKDQAAAAAQ